MKIKSILLAVASIFGLANSILAQCNSNFGFFTIETSTKNLCFVDTIGSITTIGPTNIPNSTLNYHSMDFDKNGNLWFLYSDTLYLINRDNGKAQPTQIINGINETGGQILGLSFNNSNIPYIHFEVSNTPPGTLYYLDNLYNANATPLPSSTGIASILGIEFDDQDNLWALDECCINKVHQLDLSTGQAISNSFPSFNLSESPADLDYNNGVLYGLAFGTNTTTFFRTSTSSGTISNLFTLNGIFMGIAGGYINSNVIYDTTFVTVTDTLIINAVLTGVIPPNNINTLKIYPNPSSTHITIDNGDYTSMNGYTIRIENSLSQTVFTSLIDQSSFYIDLSGWSSHGLYFVYIIDNLGNTIETRKIIIQ